jgi:hypothetical protein
MKLSPARIPDVASKEMQVNGTGNRFWRQQERFSLALPPISVHGQVFQQPQSVPSIMAADQAVLNLFVSNNKPYSLQNLVDLLAHAG